MAVLHMEVMSESLMRTVPLCALLPHDALGRGGRMKERGLPGCIYLLHGVFGSCTDWLYHMDLRSLSERYNVAFVMPSGENMFYRDYEDTHALYGQFVGEELVDLTRRMFRISDERTKTVIAGLSMGGYGALLAGMSHPETFGVAMGFSSALVYYGAEARTDDAPIFIESRAYAERIFGGVDGLSDTEANPAFRARALLREGRTLPRVYMTCGTEDSLLGPNERLVREFRDTGANVDFEEWHGRHEWPFWTASLERGLAWLGLERGGETVSSGNI